MKCIVCSSPDVVVQCPNCTFWVCKQHILRDANGRPTHCSECEERIVSKAEVNRQKYDAELAKSLEEDRLFGRICQLCEKGTFEGGQKVICNSCGIICCRSHTTEIVDRVVQEDRGGYGVLVIAFHRASLCPACKPRATAKKFKVLGGERAWGPGLETHEEEVLYYPYGEHSMTEAIVHDPLPRTSHKQSCSVCGLKQGLFTNREPMKVCDKCGADCCSKHEITVLTKVFIRNGKRTVKCKWYCTNCAKYPQVISVFDYYIDGVNGYAIKGGIFRYDPEK